MSFVPLLPYDGSDGWSYLKQTLDTQRSRHEAALPTATAIELAMFRNGVAKAETAEKLVDNAALVKVALQAFGLGKTQPTRAFLIKTLETATSGADADKAFADPRWFELARAFGYGDGTAKVADTGFADEIVARWRIQSFDEAIGAASPEMRRALAFDRTMASLAVAGYDEQAGWERALADPSIRPVLTAAFGLGAGFEAAPLAQQVRQLADAAEALTGSRTVDAFAKADQRDALLARFFEAGAGALSGTGSAGVRIGQSGVAGWRVLQASIENRQDGFAKATANDPELRHFARTIGGMTTAEDFVADERLVQVALTAFGLGDAKPSAEFLRKVLESDPDSEFSYASLQSDPRWREMAAAFGYGAGSGAKVAEFGFADEIASRWRLHGFEEAVGAQDADLRRALIFDRTLSTLAGAGLGETEGWSRALANPTIALALGRAFDLGEDFVAQPLDRQLTLVQDAAKAMFGSKDIATLAADGRRDRLVQAFLSNPPEESAGKGLGTPVIPLPGVAGWTFLKRTLVSQQESFAQSIPVRREMDYFRANIGRIETAEQLVADRRLLAVALEAYGLGDEVDKKAFIRKVLEEGSEDPRAFAVRMSDPRFREFASAMGFGDGKGAQTSVDGFAEKVLARYKVRAFERAVGEVDDSMRLALNFDRAMNTLAGSGADDKAAWYRVLGDVPLRTVLEGAYGLPSGFSQIDVDQQVSTLRQRTAGVLGSSTFSGFSDAGNRDDVIRRFLVREQIGDAVSPASRGLTALSILQSAASSRFSALF